MRNLVVVVLDSLRYDSWIAASRPQLDRLGEVERRWSYATWTSPSHYNLLMGLMPHTNSPRTFASEQYRQEFSKYSERLGIEDISFPDFLPTLWLPTFLKSKGYRVGARVSMPVLNPKTPLNVGFEDYKMMPTHNDMAGIVAELEFSTGQPSFWLLNVGETHYPYATPDEDPGDWPRISGLHGVLADSTTPTEFLDIEALAELQKRQVRAVTYVDEVIGQLYERVPDDTWLIVTSDHGELFGEDGFFGHGPIVHDKVLEVPFVEGLVPR